MPEEFHLFPKLPIELRDMIWEFAMRPNKPGVHFFQRRNPSGWFTYQLTLPGLVDQPRTGDHTFRGPRYVPQHNPSTYLIDEHLWFACRESRQTMERVFKTKYWEAIRNDHVKAGNQHLSRDWLENEIAMPATTVVPCDYRDPLPPCYCMVLPYQDLFCFNALDQQNVMTVPELNSSVQIGSTHYGYRGIRNIGIPFYDPGPNGGRTTRLDFDVVIQYMDRCGIPGLETLWLINYTARREHHVPTKEQAARNPKIFYGTNCKFVELIPDPNGDFPWMVPLILRVWLSDWPNDRIHQNKGHPGVRVGHLICEAL
ncbi:uncharacterized protein F4822DRAFT_428375 [Hypoxylon trugodes]|uniref:uncharacterized protein n=1 Tax=Hypoxylon trugodes TaxID=326681 RepID=UPI00218F810F|nr:uncharacterized protein F4822DRAFT_428375 [Hypoxylon trugodes]KAI1390029.1 hypothetical protein F4822DRAFT_428375 [Hypoxylon trugodes]